MCMVGSVITEVVLKAWRNELYLAEFNQNIDLMSRQYTGIWRARNIHIEGETVWDELTLDLAMPPPARNVCVLKKRS